MTKPSHAERFLRSFASSARAHYTEQGARLLVGAALVNFASSMWYPEPFKLFGWLIIITTLGLLLIPWRWHHKFGMRMMPIVIRHMRFFALGACALGVFVLYGVSRAQQDDGPPNENDSVPNFNAAGPRLKCAAERQTTISCQTI